MRSYQGSRTTRSYWTNGGLLQAVQRGKVAVMLYHLG